jgi:hypothetical protein
MKIPLHLVNKIRTMAWESPEVELCGVIHEDEVVIGENLASDAATGYVLDEACAELALMQDAIVWHTHGEKGNDNWSGDDIRLSHSTGLKQLLVVARTGAAFFYDPGFEQPYEGREWNVFCCNCETLLHDFYQREYGIELLRWVPDEAEPWKIPGWDEYRQQLLAHGFEQYGEDEPLQRGDVILMRSGEAVAPNHAAIVWDATAGTILHHMAGKLSVIEDYRLAYRRSAYAVYRHPQV